MHHRKKFSPRKGRTQTRQEKKPTKPERIQKVLARSGYGSRRYLETCLSAGRITINRRVAQLGDCISCDDQVYLDNRRCTLIDELRPRLLIYHKPVGVICTRHDPEGRKTVFDALPTIRAGRWINIGRLDINTSGLLLFTNDGELAHSLMHPSQEWEREYAVRVIGAVDASILSCLRRGVMLEDGEASFNRIIDAGGTGANHWFRVVVKEGRKHLVRRLWDSQGLTVSRLMRVRFGSIHLPARLARGRYEELDSTSVQSLMQTHVKTS